MKINLSKLANSIQAYKSCVKNKNAEWEHNHMMYIEEMEKLLPHGSGFDSGSQISIEECTDNKIVIHTSFHHMDEWGGYDGWTYHNIVVRPAFIGGFSVEVLGSDRNNVKEYIQETFYNLFQ